MTDLIRFTYQGTSYRLKIPQILNLSDYDYLKVLFYIVNQETHLSVVDCLQAVSDAADDHYMGMINDHAVNKDLVRFEKHMIWTRFMLFKVQDPKCTPGSIKRPEITNGCRGAYQEILQKTVDMLLNYYGIVYLNYVEKTGFKGTAYTLARLMAVQDDKTLEELNGIREHERRHNS